MTVLQTLKRKPTKTLAAMVRLVKLAQRRHQYVPTESQFIASVATSIVNRRKRK